MDRLGKKLKNVLLRNVYRQRIVSWKIKGPIAQLVRAPDS